MLDTIGPAQLRWAFGDMKHWSKFIAAAFGLLVVAALLWPALKPARTSSGAGINWQLLSLEVAKARWAAAHKGEDWPKIRDIVPYLATTNYANRFAPIRQVRHEIYIVNKIGEPVYAFDTSSERLFVLPSNDLPRIQVMKQ